MSKCQIEYKYPHNHFGVNTFNKLLHDVTLRHISVLFVPVFVSPERSSERDYVITDSVRSMYVVCVCMW